MKLIVVLCLVAVTVAAPPPNRGNYKYSPNDVQLLNYENKDLGDGSYRFSFETSDGTRREEQGSLRNEGREDESLDVKGSYTWVGPDGITYTITYVADDNGFQPVVEQGPGGAVPGAVVASLLG